MGIRKITRKGWIRKLDRLVSQAVVKRDKKCFTCNTTENLQCGHLFTRSLYSVRWDLDNCKAQCQGCNFRHEFDPSVYQLKFIDQHGLEAYKDLYRTAHRSNKLSDKQLRELYERIRLLV